jgi:hypothetical protein
MPPATAKSLFSKVRVRIVSYALSYEKAVSNRPFRWLVDPFAIVPAHPKRSGKTSYPLLTRCFRRHLLRAKERLPLAAFAPRLSSSVFRLLPFQKIPIELTVVLLALPHFHGLLALKPQHHLLSF